MDVQDVVDECERRIKVLKAQETGHFLDPDELVKAAKIHAYYQVVGFINGR